MLPVYSVFREQLVPLLNKGDIVVGISASGNSPNILNAIDYARRKGAVTIGFCGFRGGKLKGSAHRSIVLSSRDYGQVEDSHLCLSHIISYLVRERIKNIKEPFLPVKTAGVPSGSISPS